MAKGPNEHFLSYTLRALGLLTVAAGATSGLTILSYQVYLRLKTGNWVGFPLTYFLEKAGVDLAPVYHPQGWKGVAGVVRVIIETQAGLCLLIGGLVLMVLGAFFQWLSED